jgi:hypothetical protein
VQRSFVRLESGGSVGTERPGVDGGLGFLLFCRLRNQRRNRRRLVMTGRKRRERRKRRPFRHAVRAAKVCECQGSRAETTADLGLRVRAEFATGAANHIFHLDFEIIAGRLM